MRHSTASGGDSDSDAVNHPPGGSEKLVSGLPHVDEWSESDVMSNNLPSQGRNQDRLISSFPEFAPMLLDVSQCFQVPDTQIYNINQFTTNEQTFTQSPPSFDSTPSSEIEFDMDGELVTPRKVLVRTARTNNDPSRVPSRTPSSEGDLLQAGVGARSLTKQKAKVALEPQEEISSVVLPMPHEENFPIHERRRYHQTRTEVSDPTYALPSSSTLTVSPSRPLSSHVPSNATTMNKAPSPSSGPIRSRKTRASQAQMSVNQTDVVRNCSSNAPSMSRAQGPSVLLNSKAAELQTQPRMVNLGHLEYGLPPEGVAVKQTTGITSGLKIAPTGTVTQLSSQENLMPSASSARPPIDWTSNISAHVGVFQPFGTGVGMDNTVPDKGSSDIGMGYHPYAYSSRTRAKHHMVTRSLSDTPSLRGNLGNGRPSLSLHTSQPHLLSLSSEDKDFHQAFHLNRTSEDEVATRLTQQLASVLRSSRLRNALCRLQGGQAQLMVEYLYNLVQQPSSSIPWLQKHALIALYRLSKSSLLHPHCYTLKDITIDSHENGGGFSDIFRGHHGNQHVCLKVVRLHQKSEIDALLKVSSKEAILWGQMHHPNVVPFYGIYYLNEERRQICLVSPWMQNGNLVQYLKNNPSVSRSLFVHDIAAGLEYLHSRSLIHSDLKGVNVLVNDAGIACITDFGLSTIRTDRTLAYTTIATTVQGVSHRWAAPELMEDYQIATMASDVWALGCVFYEVLTGKLPFHGLSDMQIIRKLVAGATPQRPEPSDVQFVHGGVAICALIQDCWVIEPEGRPTCRTILEALISKGLTRSDDTNSTGNDMHSGRLRFEEAMKMSQQVPIDRVAVEDILGAISAGKNQVDGTELGMDEPPYSPLPDLHDPPSTIDPTPTSESAGIDVPMIESPQGGSMVPTDIQSWQNLSSYILGTAVMSSDSERLFDDDDMNYLHDSATETDFDQSFTSEYVAPMSEVQQGAPGVLNGLVVSLSQHWDAST